MKEQSGKSTGDSEALQAVRKDSETLYPGSRNEVRSIACRLAEQAERSLLVHSTGLDADIFDQEPFLQAATRLAVSHRDSRVLLLVHDARKVVQENNRLVKLARRLSTHIRIRRPAVQHRDYHEMIVLADDDGYLQCSLPGRYEGCASYRDPGKTRDLKNDFMDIWEHAEPDPELRRLHL